MTKPDPTRPTRATYEGALRASGLRMTAPRVAVLEQVHAKPHADVDTLLSDVGAAASVPHQTVDTPDPRGFVIDEAEVTYWGLRPDCQPVATGAV